MTADGFYFYDGVTPRKFAGVLESWKQYFQVPIKADELTVRISADTPAEPFSDVVYVVDGIHVFHGSITRVGDLGNAQRLTCLSKQWTLDWRPMPYYVYYNVDLNTILSSDTPSTVMGMMLLANGHIPNGKWTYYNAIVRNLVDGGLKSCLRDKALYASTSFPNAGTIDDLDGVVQLTDAGAIPTADDTYYRTVDDLYVLVGDGSYRENATVIVAKDWCDTRIVFGSCDIGTYKSAAAFAIEGVMAKVLDDIIQKIGREVEFLPRNDWTLHMDIAEEIPGRSSETSPLKTYIDGVNCKIVPSTQSPGIQAAISYGSDICEAPQCVSDWKRGTALIKCYQNQGYQSEEVLGILQGLVEDSQESYTVTTNEVDPVLRPGDWVGIQIPDEVDIALRIREKTIAPGKMTLLCGKKLVSASSIFGSYLRGSIPDDAQPRSTTTLVSQSSFEVSSENYDLGGLRVFYEESFSEEDDTDIDTGAFMTLDVNGKIVPPGRILLSKAESVKIDITDYSIMPGTNTVTRGLYNDDGWTSSERYVKQYLAVKFIAP
ncbi:hypothetical protein M0R72_08640 [Candidatus Pacearchaeota archaeon]|jgi:hypothetical protein|nr:hypothetical protein [Candidatus Pacearchaeota archaeon]